MPTVLSNKQSPPHRQNIYQNQSKHTKNREAHGDVRQDKYADSRVRGASDQPVMDSDPSRTSVSDTAIPRTKKHSRPPRLSQLATWVEDPIVFKIRKLARDKNLSQSKALRRVVIKGLSTEDGELTQALDFESAQERHAADYRRLAKRLTRLLVMLLFDVGQIKAHTTNLLGMQKGMSEDMLKDILRDADKHTRRKFSRNSPDLNEFADTLEQWLLSDEEASQEGGGGTNGTRGRGGQGL